MYGRLCCKYSRQKVSLFTREWIEMSMHCRATTALRSPSLRGSGLKSLQRFGCLLEHRRLPLYEGVD